MDSQTTKAELIKGDEFERALLDAANVKRENLTSLKTRNRDNYARFYDIMLMSRNDIQSILDAKRKDRTDADNAKVKEFKKETSNAYRQICQLLAPEVLEDGEPTKLQKLVRKVAPLVRLMQYIGNTEIDREFAQFGVTLSYRKLQETNPVFENAQIEANVKEIFENGKNLRGETEKNNEAIKTTIFETSVPPELQFEKSTNPSGIRSSDFCKLVDLKTKMLMAQSDEQKEKVDERANDMAGQCEFDSARNSLIQSKLIDLQSQEGKGES